MAISYIVQNNDTLFRIARRFGTNVTALYSANPQLRERQYVYPGQVLQIPASSAQQYVIQPGDTFHQIARRLQISLNDLIAANPYTDPQQLQAGQTLVIPHSRGMSVVNTNSEYGYEEMMEDIRLLKQRYPFLQVSTIGTSVLGRSIPAIRLGSGPKEIHYNGAFHANEWITSQLLMKFIEDYAEAYQSGQPLRGKDVRKLYEQTSLWIVPMVDPDGVELVLKGASPENPYYEQLIEWNFGSHDFTGWKANIRGVDLNDQFPAGWEIERERREAAGPGPRDYTGTAPLSEPEAKAMADFTRAHNFRLVIAFHTQGQEIYWNYRDLEPEDAESIADRLAKVSRYRAVKLQNSDAGYKDWFIQEFRRPGFTVEAGFGVNPLPQSQFRSMYDEVVAIMLEALIL
ncbi:M14 family zinc carboxypeptidase [Paenibacillus piri]|uniref:LysM peptidoglycan-binding domain-containing protein n=1 Tax=Paenibacillus piri TaxID=2547395 RepID=A0A4R5KK35_9BACL|nr:M14 family zinc carboxypeptidase [Paenibacillus piri]TDF95806.1 LysM peptidoglycan-binding domain-containing protein [Paenibacillus piri]